MSLVMIYKPTELLVVRSQFQVSLLLNVLLKATSMYPKTASNGFPRKHGWQVYYVPN